MVFENFDVDLKTFVSRRKERDANERIHKMECRALIEHIQSSLEASLGPGTMLSQMGWKEFNVSEDGLVLQCIHANGHLFDVKATGRECANFVDPIERRICRMPYGEKEIKRQLLQAFDDYDRDERLW